MRDPTLHSILESFTAEAAGQLTAETARGAEIPFELVQAGSDRRGRPALYCYRPLTGEFISAHVGVLTGLPGYVPALRALADREGTAEYLRVRGQAPVPNEPRARADAALAAFLSQVFAGRTNFVLDASQFHAAYGEFEAALYEGQCVCTVIAPVFGLALESEGEVPIDDELALVPGPALANAPAEAAWDAEERPTVLVSLRVAQDRSDGPPIALAASRFRSVVTSLRLFEDGRFALGPLAWTRTDNGAWRAVAVGGTGRLAPATTIGIAQEDELRAFCNLISKRAPASGELAWALTRYEMGCERHSDAEALTDYLLAARALLEPEGPESGRLAGRLAAICASPQERAALAERIAGAVLLEREVIIGLESGDNQPAEPARELSQHLRAILRDVLCGHLGADLCGLADGLLAEAAVAV